MKEIFFFPLQTKRKTLSALIHKVLQSYFGKVHFMSCLSAITTTSPLLVQRISNEIHLITIMVSERFLKSFTLNQHALQAQLTLTDWNQMSFRIKNKLFQVDFVAIIAE